MSADDQRALDVMHANANDYDALGGEDMLDRWEAEQQQQPPPPPPPPPQQQQEQEQEEEEEFKNEQMAGLTASFFGRDAFDR